jgi:secondary thiamine-phosphate synthase enzyme
VDIAGFRLDSGTVFAIFYPPVRHHNFEVLMFSGQLVLTTSTHMELVDISGQIQDVIDTHRISTGFCYLFNPHTTAGLTINEGADPAVRADIITGFRQIVPLHPQYRHGEGNSPAHIMASLMGCSLTLAIANSRLLLGTWQKVFFCEFDGPRTRQIHWRLGETPQL